MVGLSKPSPPPPSPYCAYLFWNNPTQKYHPHSNSYVPTKDLPSSVLKRVTCTFMWKDRCRGRESQTKRVCSATSGSITSVCEQYSLCWWEAVTTSRFSRMPRVRLQCWNTKRTKRLLVLREWPAIKLTRFCRFLTKRMSSSFFSFRLGKKAAYYTLIKWFMGANQWQCFEFIEYLILKLNTTEFIAF